ncbi:MAG TPA: hypothetical protein PKX78_02220 [Candidatus Woesebacteria bacterium]|nr:hypothetical protein [Candidatus Woesebacteria bacterium]
MKTKEQISHHVIILPGLSDNTVSIQLATKWWRIFGIETHIASMGWKNPNTNLDQKLAEIIDLARSLASNGRVSILGTSAGGSAAINTFLLDPKSIQKAVSVCGRLRAGKHNLRSLDKKSACSPAFRQSVVELEYQEPSMPDELRTRILTITALFGDELVPRDTSKINGTNNIFVPSAEHVLTIGLSLTIFAKPIINFLRKV